MSALLTSIRQAVIGEQTQIVTPFGNKPLIYADYTASGRSLDIIEDFIRQRVLPFYANTHSESSYTGAQTNSLREQARDEIKQAVNANSDDCVIFCGTGATAAIHKLIDILNLRLPADLNERYQWQQTIPSEERPTVFIGPYEHHSNELPWRESIAEIITIPLTQQGDIDRTILTQKLEKYQSRPLKIASFSAASNVTGIKTDVEDIAKLLQQYGFLSFWDYAAAAPYVAIDMAQNKDAVFLSPHKFIGGPGTPGILVVKRKLLTNRIPAVSGGGTVVYVSPEHHRYTKDLERKEEAGTPGIIESIRAGLVFKLQQQVGLEEIEKREHDFINKALQVWSECKNIEILGNTEIPRLGIFSLRIYHQHQELHYGFVVALLNDVFGIQARGGCSCAGPYGHALLNLNMEKSRQIESQLLKGHMILRPGWVRLSFNYFIDDDTFHYLVNAIKLIAEHGWRLLPYYHYDQTTGSWRFQKQPPQLETQLNDINFLDNSNVGIKKEAKNASKNLQSCLIEAKQSLLGDYHHCEKYILTLCEEVEDLRWFYKSA